MGGVTSSEQLVSTLRASVTPNEAHTETRDRVTAEDADGGDTGASGWLSDLSAEQVLAGAVALATVAYALGGN